MSIGGIMTIIYALIVVSAMLAILFFFYLKTLRNLRLLKRYFSKIEFALLHERQKHQIVSAELSEIKQRFAQEIISDPLTGLPARQVFEDRLMNVLHQSQRFQLTFAVVFLNIDEFNMINDVLGYDAGDELLKETAQRLKTCIRQADTLSHFSRHHFALILSQLIKPETAIFVVKRLLDVFLQPFQMKDQELFLTASVGVAVYPGDGEEAQQLLKNADTALNQARARGKNNYQFFEQEMHDFSLRELMLTSSLRNPAFYHRLVLHYQPQMDVREKKINSLQTFLSWEHPEFGIVHTDEFLRLAENSGKMLEISEWILRQALNPCSRRHHFDLQHIFVPVSLRQLESSHFIYKVSEILQQLNLNPRCLVLEIFDDSFLPTMGRLEKSFNMLKHLGVKISAAHFGIGHLSLQQIQKLSVNYLMIDASLVRDMINNKQSETMIRTIIAIATSLQITAIAEGVENRRQQALLIELGCHVMRGPLFGPMLLGAELERSMTSP
jgi:diguanylate cyclase (GGDEF)-like protein